MGKPVLNDFTLWVTYLGYLVVDSLRSMGNIVGISSWTSERCSALTINHGRGDGQQALLLLHLERFDIEELCLSSKLVNLCKVLASFIYVES